VIEAVDGVSDKAAILHSCVRSGTPVVSSGGVGGLCDPTLLRVSDLARAAGDALLMRVRKKLRQDYGYPKDVGGVGAKKAKEWQIMVAHTQPTGAKRGGGGGASLASPGDQAACSLPELGERGPSKGFRQCDLHFGSASFLSGAVGFLLAAEVVNALAEGRALSPRPLEWMLSPSKGRSGPVGRTYDGLEPVRGAAVLVHEEESGGGSDAKAAEEDRLEHIAPVHGFDFLGKGGGEATLFDAHCHLQLSPLFEKADAAIEQARRLGVHRLAVCATCPGELD
jgi:hypothetical protein